MTRRRRVAQAREAVPIGILNATMLYLVILSAMAFIALLWAVAAVVRTTRRARRRKERESRVEREIAESDGYPEPRAYDAPRPPEAAVFGEPASQPPSAPLRDEITVYLGAPPAKPLPAEPVVQNLRTSVRPFAQPAPDARPFVIEPFAPQAPLQPSTLEVPFGAPPPTPSLVAARSQTSGILPLAPRWTAPSAAFPPAPSVAESEEPPEEPPFPTSYAPLRAVFADLPEPVRVDPSDEPAPAESPAHTGPAAASEQHTRPLPSGSRADWRYFNKDMGDLTDPAPAQRPAPRPHDK